MKSECNIVLAGVGGQGTILTAEILGTAALKSSLNVRVSEIHGMAQRGGAVTSCVRIGEKVLSPTVNNGDADVLLGFEPLETVRSLNFASSKTLVILSDEQIPPTDLASKKIDYPSLESVIEKIRTFTENIQLIKTTELAKEAGGLLTRNMILLGALSASEILPIKTETMVEALKELVPQKYEEINVKAFKLGYDSLNGSRR